MDQAIVDRATFLLRQYAKERKLGRPRKLLTCETPGLLGVGVEWSKQHRTAVSFFPQLRSEYEEVLRQVQDWVDDQDRGSRRED